MATQVKNWSPTAAGSAVVTGCALQIRDGETGAIRRTLYDESNVWDVAFSPDGKSVAAALDGENVVKLWDPWTGKEQKTFDAKIDGDLDKISANLTKVAFSRDGRLLAAAGRIRNLVIGEWKAIVILWEIGSGKLLWQVQDHTHKIDAWIDALVFSPDGKLLATGSRQDATTKLRDTATGQCKQTIQFPEGGSAWSLAFSPDGKQLASGGMDGRVCLWDADSGKLKLVLTNGYLRGQLVVAFSPDGKWVAAGGTTLGTKDNGCCGDVRLFDAKTGKFDRAFHDILGTGVRALAFSPGGETLAVGNWMKQILLLPIQKDPAR